MVALGADGFHLHGFPWRSRRGDGRLGREVEGDAEDVGVFRIEEALLVEVVGLAAQGAADDLLAEELGAEGSNAEDVCDIVRIPPLGEHGDGDDATDARTELVCLSDRVHHFAQKFLIRDVVSGARVAGAFDDIAAEAFDLVGGHGAEVVVEGVSSLELLRVDEKGVRLAGEGCRSSHRSSGKERGGRFQRAEVPSSCLR
jgi:hypothetical protein